MKPIDIIAIIGIGVLAIIFLVTRENTALAGLMSIITFYFGRESAKAEVSKLRKRRQPTQSK